MKRIDFTTAKLASVVFPHQAVELDYTIEDDDGKIYFIPFQGELQEWLRNEHKLNVIVDFTDNTKVYGYDVVIYNSNKREFHDEDMIDQAIPIHLYQTYPTYEDALEEGLVQALKILIDAK